MFIDEPEMQIAAEALKCPVARERCPVVETCRRLAADNQRLAALARVDELTGYYNYRHLQAALAAEMERTRRTGLETGVIIADLDHFKRINDTFGHETGNAALKHASRIWLDGIRQMDIACRYGGEEFVFILPGTHHVAVVGAAQRLRKTLMQTPVRAGGQEIRLTASFGVDGYRPEDAPMSAEDLLAQADRHLLEAKNQGRNRVCYDDSRWLAPPTEVSEAERRGLFARADR